MKVVHAQTDVNEHFPDEIFDEGFPGLLAYVIAQVTVVTELHDDVYFFDIDEGVEITNYELAV